ncbi:hypothetical protein [Aliihoeflea sp. 2WW]|uniref:hypothetical protein n=1 Tax=Aliihoeflea sp. 2WW TaxID=1381123 RepID=UPI000466FBA3|nr:hypothetical protein [Aliihoeflea sp. 2WW]
MNDTTVPLQKLHTVDSLRRRTLEERAAIYDNCLRQGGPAADEVIGMLQTTGLPYTKQQEIYDGHPIYRAIELVIGKTENIELMLDSAAKGRPPVEAVDPLIAAELKSDYGAHNGGTVTAGYLVGQVMYSRGYEKQGQTKLKTGCVAKTGTLFRKRKSG